MAPASFPHPAAPTEDTVEVPAREHSARRPSLPLRVSLLGVCSVLFLQSRLDQVQRTDPESEPVVVFDLVQDAPASVSVAAAEGPDAAPREREKRRTRSTEPAPSPDSHQPLRPPTIMRGAGIATSNARSAGRQAAGQIGEVNVERAQEREIGTSDAVGAVTDSTANHQGRR